MKRFILISFLFLGLFLLPQIVSSVDISAPPEASGSIPKSINHFYNVALALGGIAAVGVIVAGGIMYATSGAIDKKNLGKELITSAIWGLVLLLGAFIILNTINPELTNLTAPGLREGGVGGFKGQEYKIGDPDDPFSCENQPNLSPCGSDEVADDKDAGCCNPNYASQCPQDIIDNCPQKVTDMDFKVPTFPLGKEWLGWIKTGETTVHGTKWQWAYYPVTDGEVRINEAQCVTYAYQETGSIGGYETEGNIIYIDFPDELRICNY